MSTPTIVAPPRPDKRQSAMSKDRFLGFINLAHASHFLKLRHSWKASDQLRIEFGLNYNISSNQTTPWTGVRLDLADRLEGWAVEANTDMAVVCTPQIDLIPFTDKLSLPIDARLGRDWFNGGQPHIEVGIHNAGVAACLVAVSLATNQPVHLKRKETGGFSVSLPIRFKDGSEVAHTAAARAEIDASLQRREGRGLELEIHQLNAVLRLRQD